MKKTSIGVVLAVVGIAAICMLVISTFLHRKGNPLPFVPTLTLFGRVTRITFLIRFMCRSPA